MHVAAICAPCAAWAAQPSRGQCTTRSRTHLPAQVANWSRVGRLRRAKCPNLGSGGGAYGGGASQGLLNVMAGVLLGDTYVAARELVRELDFTLGTLARSLLGQERYELPPSEVPGSEQAVLALPHETVTGSAEVLRGSSAAWCVHAASGLLSWEGLT